MSDPFRDLSGKSWQELFNEFEARAQRRRNDRRAQHWLQDRIDGIRTELSEIAASNLLLRVRIEVAAKRHKPMSIVMQRLKQQALHDCERAATLQAEALRLGRRL